MSQRPTFWITATMSPIARKLSARFFVYLFFHGSYLKILKRVYKNAIFICLLYFALHIFVTVPKYKVKVTTTGELCFI